MGNKAAAGQSSFEEHRLVKEHRDGKLPAVVYVFLIRRGICADMGYKWAVMLLYY